MNSTPLIHLEITLDELVEAFGQLPPKPESGMDHQTVAFSIPDDYGNPSEKKLLFKWHDASGSWHLDAKGHDLVITK